MADENVRATILFVEDDDSLREVLTFNLEEAGHRVDAVDRGERALEVYDPARHEVVITDIKMPGLDGMEVLRRLRERDPDANVLVMTAYGNIDRAVEAMRLGAFHYVEKPVNNLTLQHMIGRAVEHRRFKRENARLQDAVSEEMHGAHTIVTASPKMNEVLRLVDRVASSDATILIRGESGTGKELVARALHERSTRADESFVTINCAAIPSELLESVLFGHEKGAFTGATSASPGKFASADGGTIFLDEIGEMPAELQSKLLRVLQEGEIDVVGADRPRPIDVRVLAATHQDLEALVEAETFRHDLYYRLNVVPLELPPLRERREDIPVLTRFFLRRHAPDADIGVERAVDEVMLGYDWPGNVRELENIVERMILLRDGDTLILDDLPASIKRASASGGPGGPPEDTELPFELPDDGLDLMELEKQIIAAALDKHDGNQSATARYLSIPRHVLLYRLEKYDLA
jgi:two-component system NtrC family response regulator